MKGTGEVLMTSLKQNRNLLRNFLRQKVWLALGIARILLEQ